MWVSRCGEEKDRFSWRRCLVLASSPEQQPGIYTIISDNTSLVTALSKVVIDMTVITIATTTLITLLMLLSALYLPLSYTHRSYRYYSQGSVIVKAPCHWYSDPTPVMFVIWPYQ